MGHFEVSDQSNRVTVTGSNKGQWVTQSSDTK